MQEFLKFFPERRDDWFLIPFISAHNVNGEAQAVKELVNQKYSYTYPFLVKERTISDW